MAVQFYSIKVKEVRKETADCVSVVFDIPAQLITTFTYKSGQYITIRINTDGGEVRRSYSLCSTPAENEWRIAVKKVPGGLMSSFINEQLRQGDTVECMPPMGNFVCHTDKTQQKKYIAFTAGSGITPVISIIKSVLYNEPHSSFTLIYGNRNRHSIIFKDALEALKNKYIERFSIVHIFSREITDAAINTGRIDSAKCHELFTRFTNIDADAFFICGPKDMMLCIHDFLKAHKVDEKKIHIELFTSSANHVATTRKNIVTSPDEKQSTITIRHDGNVFNFDITEDGENILDAALYRGIDLPYSCKSGVCCTCKAKLVEGKVNMEANYGLDPEELNNGFILCCQSHPATNNVVIDFDIK